MPERVRQPKAGKRYRILDVIELEYRHLTGFHITLDSVGERVGPNSPYWQVVGRVGEYSGSYDITAYLLPAAAVVCHCPRLTFPHQESPACRARRT